MSNNLIYNYVKPNNEQATYSEFSVVDFDLDFDGQSMLANTIRIDGQINVTKASSAALAGTEKIFYDEFVGCHGLFESITTSTQAGGILESLNSYPRMVVMNKKGTNSRPDLLHSDQVCELVAPVREMTTDFMVPKQPDADGGTQGDSALTILPDFSVKPMIALNQASGNLALSYSKTGRIRITVHMARLRDWLYGEDVNADINYEVSDLRLRYISTAGGGKGGNTVMKSKITIKQNINSNQSNISTKIPGICNSFVASFIKSGDEHQLTKNNNELQTLVPEQTEFLFNDNITGIISYEIDNDREELQDRAMRAFTTTFGSSVSLENLASNNFFCVGLNFGKYLDFSKTKFNLQMKFAPNENLNNNNYTIHLFFNTLIQM